MTPQVILPLLLFHFSGGADALDATFIPHALVRADPSLSGREVSYGFVSGVGVIAKPREINRWFAGSLRSLGSLRLCELQKGVEQPELAALTLSVGGTELGAASGLRPLLALDGSEGCVIRVIRRAGAIRLAAAFPSESRAAAAGALAGYDEGGGLVTLAVRAFEGKAGAQLTDEELLQLFSVAALSKRRLEAVGVAGAVLATDTGSCVISVPFRSQCRPIASVSEVLERVRVGDYTTAFFGADVARVRERWDDLVRSSVMSPFHWQALARVRPTLFILATQGGVPE